MTKELAIQILSGDVLGTSEQTHEAIKMAIKALVAEPIKHGHWIFEEYPDGYYHSQCSLCNSWFVGDAFLNPYNYCPNCGAKMEGGEG